MYANLNSTCLIKEISQYGKDLVERPWAPWLVVSVSVYARDRLNPSTVSPPLLYNLYIKKIAGYYVVLYRIIDQFDPSVDCVRYSHKPAAGLVPSLMLK